MSAGLDWQRDGGDWPHREHSTFVEAGGLSWHVQRMGEGPALLLLHGTGASVHSWRDVMPPLAASFSVVAIDLPGHAFTDAAPSAEQASLPGIARLVGALLAQLGVRPVLIAGHSAGAAIALRLVLDGLAAPRTVVAFNGALLPWGGFAGLLFLPVARLFAANSLAARLFAWRAHDDDAVRRLIDSTGSKLDARGIALYARLMRSRGHVAGALAMMANWDLDTFEVDLPRLQVPLTLVVGTADGTVPAEQSRIAARRVPGAELIELPGLGHLAHEEAPRRAADIVLEQASRDREAAR